MKKAKFSRELHEQLNSGNDAVSGKKKTYQEKWGGKERKENTTGTQDIKHGGG